MKPFLYVAMKTGGISILRLIEGGDPTETAKVPVKDLEGLDAMHCSQIGDRLYVALGDHFAFGGAPAGLAIIEVKNPAAPKVLGTWRTAKSQGGASMVVTDGKLAYLAAMRNGVTVLDVSKPAAIKEVSTFLPDVNFPLPNPKRAQHPNARGLALVGRRLYVANDAGGLRILDVADPARLRELGRYANAGMGAKQQAFNNIVVDGDTLYAAVDYAGIETLDIRDPARIKPLGWWNPWAAETLANLWVNSPGHVNQLELDRKRRLLYLSAGDAELQVLDVADPKFPKLVSQYGKAKDDRGAWGVALGSDTAYLAYIDALLPFRGTFSGVLSVKRHP